MSEWIECNLPWHLHTWAGDGNYKEELLDIQEELDKVRREYLEELEELRDLINEVIFSEVPETQYGLVAWEKVDKHKLAPYRNDIIDTIREKTEDMLLEPIYLEEARRSETYEENRKLLSFCGRELNKPGVLVEVNGKQYLLGHINAENVDAGCCGSSAFEDKDIVTRYKVIWSSNE